MAVVKQSSNGKWYVNIPFLSGKNKLSRDWFLVKNVYKKDISSGFIRIGNTGDISFPKEFVGKRIRIRIEDLDAIETSKGKVFILKDINTEIDLLKKSFDKQEEIIRSLKQRLEEVRK